MTAQTPKILSGAEERPRLVNEAVRKLQLLLARVSSAVNTTAFAPATSDGLALGTASLMWSDLFLASGAVINWNNGDATLTHSSNKLAFAGATGGYVFDSKIGIGTTAPESGVHVVDVAVTSQPRGLTVDNYVNQINAGSILLRHARGTVASPSAVLSGDALGSVCYNGHDGSGFTSEHQSIVTSWAAQDWTGSHKGTYLTLQLTPTNSTSIGETARFTGDGYNGFNVSSPECALEVANGLMRIKGAAVFGSIPTTGEGMELGYDTTSHGGAILAYNRSTSAFKLIVINSVPLALNADSGGNVTVGVASSDTGNAKLDILGSFATRAIALTLSNGANSDIVITNGAYARISGPSAGFSVSGFAGGVNGRHLTIYNSTTQAMTITNAATSTAANQILTLTGADVVQSGVSSASFIYDATDTKWILVASQA